MSDQLRRSSRVTQSKVKNVTQIDVVSATSNKESVTVQAISRTRTKRNALVTVSTTEKKKKLSLDVGSVKEAEKKLVKRGKDRKLKEENDKFVTSYNDGCNISTKIRLSSVGSVKENKCSSQPSTRKRKKKIKDEEGGKPHNEIEEARAEVDIECTEKISNAHVFRQGVNFYDAMLNQTNISNNNNKYFLMQVLENNTEHTYSVWFRWGRVGFRGQTNLINCGGDFQKAIDIFCKKFIEKTCNKFEERNNFQKYPGKYDLIKVDYKKKNKEIVVESNVKDCEEDGIDLPVCLLEEKVRRVMELICDLKQMERDIRNMEYDVKKCPLGNISKEQVKAGYEALCVIEKHIISENFNSEYLQAMNNYYTRIPHCFGMRVPPQIRVLSDLKNEITLLEMLGEVEIAVNALTKQSEGRTKLHPLDLRYQQLKWELLSVEHSSELFKIIEKYLYSSHGKTHSSYKIRLSNVFELRLTDENIVAKNKAFRQNIGNRTLLWHGSRMTNLFGILSQGLRIAPPEAPVTGYMFGKGVYFADSSSKSANYTMPEPTKPRFMILSEVALGTMNELYEGNSRAHTLPDGKHSVKGVGRYYPDPKGDVIIDGVRVPCGQFLEVDKTEKCLQLLYNEYIVYDTRQISERFLVELHFDFDFNL